MATAVSIRKRAIACYFRGSLLSLGGGRFAAGFPKPMLKVSQVHPLAPEAHPLRFQQEALLQGEFAGHRTASPRPQNTMPGQPVHLLKNSSDVAGTARITSGGGDCAVGAHTPTRNLADSVTEGIHKRRFRRVLKFHRSS